MCGSRSPNASIQDGAPVPLVVDIDALLGIDALVESAFAVVRARPTVLLQLPLWLARGRHGVRENLARQAPPEILAQGYPSDVLAYIRTQKAEGRALGLVGGDDEGAAQRVARELGLFDAVWAGAGFRNLSSRQRREALRQQFGVGDFDYLAGRGDGRLRRDARGVLLVAPSRDRMREVARAGTLKEVFSRARGGPMDYLRALRPHHWIKNLLLFVAIGAAHRLPDTKTLGDLSLAFVAFSACASSGYLLNDLFDLHSDASQPQTTHRQLANRLIRPSRALLLLTLLLVGAVVIGCRLPGAFLHMLVAYFLLMALYSMRLKEVAVLDVLILAGGYALRVGAGSFVAHIRPSVWLMALCMFLFLSLASIKRYAELIAVGAASGPSAKVRGYVASDQAIVGAEGIASGYVAVLVLALYTNTSVAERLYRRRELVWVICLLLLYWLNYLWLMARRGRIGHDPLVFAFKDRTSLILLAAMAVAALCAL